MKIEKNGREYVKCELCPRYATFDNAAKLGWDWFTGTLPRVHHYCKTHSDHPLRNETFKLAGMSHAQRHGRGE